MVTVGLHADPASEDVAQEKHVSRRGTNTLVFVPWSGVQTHIINLSKTEMDVFIPG
jgi:F-box only protein C-terminal region